MLIGQDFEPVRFELFGLELIEPNALIGDTIIAIVSFFFAFKTHQVLKQISLNKDFFKFWRLFFIVFGISFIGGGLGHSFFEIWGPPGKYFGWITSIIGIFIIEQAMISLFPKEKLRLLFKRLSWIKLVLTLAAEILVFTFLDLNLDPQKGLPVPSISAAIGSICGLFLLGRYYQKSITNGFKWFWLSVLTMIPAAIFQKMKISIHPLFDRNDMSHILLIIALILYWSSISAYVKHIKRQSEK